jgi:hypothetical protein
LGELEVLAAQVEAGTAMRLTPTGFAPLVAPVQDQTPAPTDSIDVSLQSESRAEEFAEPQEPIYSSFNFDSPVVDFASAESLDEEQVSSDAEPAAAPVLFDDLATAPIELPAFLKDEKGEAKDELF